ncbi:universal stress protein [Streptomyces sp. NRRL F-5135]|uniref:universal stress protein n=1 Tax=Streptomyces sp. NRRL F-5135 TaxID=1463858 RepID=UPI0004C72535|nr:universal stress protein [Streptomyces sp. NRRL F-5135]
MTGSVVVGIDGSGESLVAGAWAARQAELRELPLRLVRAVSAAVSPPEEDDVLERARGRFTEGRPGTEVSAVRAVAGTPSAALLDAAGSAGLLVVGARGEGGFAGLAMGSTALAVAGAAPCPVAVVPRPVAGPDGRAGTAAPALRRDVAVGVRSREAARPVLAFAFQAARLHGTALVAAHAWALPDGSPRTAPGVLEEDRATWEDEEEQRLSDVLRRWRREYPDVAVRHDVVLLHPARALVNLSHRAGLLVLGRTDGRRATDGRRVAERRLGPVAHAVLHHACCPVVVVPHE